MITDIINSKNAIIRTFILFQIKNDIGVDGDFNASILTFFPLALENLALVFFWHEIYYLHGESD